MQNRIRDRIREFLASEEGKVGVKAPLTVGIATGSVFLAQAIIAPTPALACGGNVDCPGGWCDFIECTPPPAPPTCWGVCRFD